MKNLVWNSQIDGQQQQKDNIVSSIGQLEISFSRTIYRKVEYNWTEDSCFSRTIFSIVEYSWIEDSSFRELLKRNAALIWTSSKTGLTPPLTLFRSFWTLFRKSKLLELLEHFFYPILPNILAKSVPKLLDLSERQFYSTQQCELYTVIKLKLSPIAQSSLDQKYLEDGSFQCNSCSIIFLFCVQQILHVRDGRAFKSLCICYLHMVFFCVSSYV